jgi:hypothetical protein
MGYTEAKYGRTTRVFVHSDITVLTQSSHEDKALVFPGPIKVTKVGFLTVADCATMATGCTVTFYRDKKVTANIFASDKIGAASLTTGVTTASKAITTSNTLQAGTGLIISITGHTAPTSTGKKKGIVFFDYAIPFAEEDSNKGWDGTS